MSGSVTKDNLFKPPRTRSESKADTTDRAARAIIEAEADGRDAKTRRLREARLAAEAKEPKPAPKGRARKAPAKAGGKAKPS